ncbi:mitochondrial Rho GTPase 2 isoform X2 [Pistacia vera]|uniref:mitochondrial Rho GTPase 2 isoform X1 n=1 Tax=Pistacia vera TaxID=55513 RepID=UPI001263AC14|nr:mitochondrial Rho GTPase 2 isoform X1 [Pistacia vera]XP_031263773.1 mitochondrial Rho GTPase 2 isoform X2 [Pistacia vera]
MPGGLGSSARTSVRVVVVGDRGTGKSSLISAVASESIPEKVPPVHPPTRLPLDFYPDRVPVTIIDTSSSLENKGKLNEELKKADAVVLTYACNQPMSLSRLSSYWLPELRSLEVKVPIIVAGCKLDLRSEHLAMSLEEVMGPIMQQFREIETCVECSATTMIQVPDVFYYAQKAVLHPTGPLFDHDSQGLKQRCVRALKRIFILCDQDMDGVLSDVELNDFQVKCFNAPLQPAEIVGVKRVVQEKQLDGVNDLGLTLNGFLFLHALFIEKGRLETTWAVLRKFGYGDDLELRDEFLPVPTKLAPDQSVELASEAVEFLRGIFGLYDIDNDGAVRPTELEDIFSAAPESPWDEAPYRDAGEKTVLGNLTLNGFLSEWALMTLLDPRRTLANLIYIGYGGDPASVFHVTRRKSTDRKKQRTERNVFRCFVFGSKSAGKSALLNSFLARPFSENYYPTTCERYAANVVDQLGGTKKTLILQEIPEDGVKKVLSSKEYMATCDVALFVYDSSVEHSWKRTKELLVEVARQGEISGHGVPCLLIAAKDDLDPCRITVQDSAMVSQEMGIEPPIHLSMKVRDSNNIFSRIVRAAEHPHLNIPETEVGKSRKRYRHLVNSSLMFVSVGAAVTIVGLAAYRAYAARRNASA